MLKVVLHGDAKVAVEGFGMPFANASDTRYEEWINEGKPIVDDWTLLKLLQQREFHLVVSKDPSSAINSLSEKALGAPFQFPYGPPNFKDLHFPDAWAKLLDGKKGYDFAPSYGYKDDADHLSVTAHSCAQDIVWLEQARAAIVELEWSAYFVRPSGNYRHDRAHMVVLLSEDFLNNYQDAWRCLTKVESFKVRFLPTDDDRLEWEDAPTYDCKIEENLVGGELAQHPTAKHEIALLVHGIKYDAVKRDLVDLPTFASRGDANKGWSNALKH